jgi:predicted metal-dependent phosphoesterase TrpH
VIDLHTHSTASDGSDSPRELVLNAASAGVRVLAITDHDTTAGWQEAAETARSLDRPFTLLRGTEFSCVYLDDEGHRIGLHLLGYLFDPNVAALRSARAELRENRLGRGAAIVANLVAAGYPITWPQVEAIAAGGAVGRPHIGQALLDSGVVSTVDEAFAQLLADSSPYYVEKQDIPVAEAIRLIRQARGVPVIAHPWARSRGAVLTEQAISELAELGMLGIEVDHLDHCDADRRRLAALATELGVIRTGSSDYHGNRKSVRLGAHTTSEAMYRRLIEAAGGIELIRSDGR